MTASRITGALFGVPVCIASERAEWAAAVERLLRLDAPGGGGQPERHWAIESLPDGRLRLRSAGASLGVYADAASAATALVSDVELTCAAGSPDYAVIHAGAVGVEGRAILVPGRSFSGKTALTAALVEAGGVYYSDEYALLDAGGRVHPYPRDLRIRAPGGEQGVPTGVERLGGRPAGAPAEVALIAHLRFDPAQGWCVHELAPSEATLALIDNAVAATVTPARTLDRCATAAERSRGLAGTRGEAAEAAVRLMELVA